MQGSVETWNLQGFGIVRGEDQKAYFAHFSDFEKYKSSGSRINVDVGQDVTFEPAVDAERGDRLKAADIHYDSRSALFRFAYFPAYEESIDYLARKLARAEKWCTSSFTEIDEKSLREDLETKAREHDWIAQEDQRQKEKFGSADPVRSRHRVEDRIHKIVARRKFDVLFSYIERTFERLQLEDKIVFSDTGAAFNTGLGNKFDKDIYAVFKGNGDRDGYMFDRFSDENTVGKLFPRIPEPANYLRDVSTGERVPADHLYFDFEKRIYPDYAHLLDERRSRFPDAWQGMDDQECAEHFDILLDRTSKRVRRNFRTAVPFYYPALRKIQMLLPLTFWPGSEQEDTRALVVSREGAGYSVETIMPLHWAYKNARLLTKPDREDWLDF